MTKRRTKGEGSVFKRGDGRIVGEYEDSNGKKRYVDGKSKPEVRTKLRKLLEDRDGSIAYDSEGLTVERYMDRWVESIRGQVSPACSSLARLHVKLTLQQISV
jgi:hypothetical protein